MLRMARHVEIDALFDRQWSKTDVVWAFAMVKVQKWKRKREGFGGGGIHDDAKDGAGIRNGYNLWDTNGVSSCDDAPG